MIILAFNLPSLTIAAESFVRSIFQLSTEFSDFSISGGTNPDQVLVERIRGEYDPRQLLLGLHLHGVPRRPTRGDNRHQTGLRLQHVGVKLHHSADTTGGHLGLHRGRRIESRTGIHAGT